MADATKTKPAAKKAAAPAAPETPAEERARKVHLLVLRAPDGVAILNMEAFTGESAARRELDNRIDAGWRYLALTPGEPYRTDVEVQP